MKALILGCGYLGTRVASRWLDAGYEVVALTRSANRAKQLQQSGITPVVGDVTDAASLASLPAADVVLYAVGYDRLAAASRSQVVIGGLQKTLNAVAGRAERFIFISTTSVYGQTQGEWIDEDSPTEPEGEAGRVALEAESAVSLFAPREAPPFAERKATLMRLSGLYGPDRLLRRIEQLKASEPIPGNGDAWLNLIHVDDAASAVIAAERCGQSGEGPQTYLVSDGLPVRRRDYLGRLAELHGTPPPVFDPTVASRSTGLGKRCRNTLMKSELGMTLHYPTYEDGLVDAVRRSF